MKGIVYSDHITITTIKTIAVATPKNKRSTDILERSVESFTESVEFIAAEECRKRYDRYKSARDINKTIYWAGMGKFLYELVLQRIKATYKVTLPSDAVYLIDGTPMGQLIDEIEYAISSMKETY